jgi:hypothetical protein
VTVPAALESIAVTTSSSLTIAINGTAQFKATGTYSDSSTADITGSVTWSSDNTPAATVSSTGLATAVAGGSADIIATSGIVHGQAAVTVPAAQRIYSGSASVGDFLTISINQTNNTISYTDLSNGASGTATYTTDFNGNTTLNDPAGHLLSISEVPGLGVVALMNNAGSTEDQLALVTSVTQENITTASFENQSYNMFEFRTTGGGVGIASVSLDSVGNINLTEYMPSNLIGCSTCGFNAEQFALPSVTTPAPYLLLALPPPPSSTGNNYIFGTANGMFLDDSEDGSIIGLPKAAKKDFDPSWASTYTLTYYEKSNAYGPDGNSLEAGDISWGVATLTLDVSGNLTLIDGKGNPMASGLLAAVKDTPSLYDGTTTTGQGTSGELGDPCYGVFTFTTVSGGQTQQVFVAFTQGTVLLSSFSTGSSFSPGDTYNYFYGVGTPQSSTSSASNSSNSTNPPNPPGAWNSLGGNVSATAQRLYIGSSASGDLLTFTIDPVLGTLAYYDVMNGNRSASPSTITYTLNGNGSSTVNDPSNNVVGALELPDQALFVEMNNNGYNLPPVPNADSPVGYDPAELVIALPQMNLTTADFTGQSYNFFEMEGANLPHQSSNGDLAIGSMAIDGSGNFTGSGYTPWATLPGGNLPSAFNNLDPLAFPSGDYPGPWIAATDLANGSSLSGRGAYLFGYPGSLVLLNSATQGTLIGVPQSTSAAFQPTVGGNAVTGTYEVMFFRRQVTLVDQYGESGPTGNPTGSPAPNCNPSPAPGWKCLPEVRGASMGFSTLTIAADGTATLTDPSNNSTAWTGTLAPVSSQSSLVGTGELASACCNGLYTVTGSGGAWPLVSSSGKSQQNMQIFIGFVPGTQPAVVLSTFTIQPNASTAPSSTYYQYRYGMGFKTGN